MIWTKEEKNDDKPSWVRWICLVFEARAYLARARLLYKVKTAWISKSVSGLKGFVKQMVLLELSSTFMKA